MGLHYREYSLGYAKKLFQNKLSIGIRVKLYYGKSSFISQVSGEVVNRETNFYLKTSGSMKFSAPVKTIISQDEILQPFVLMDNFTPVNYLMNSKNSGTGLDFGFCYEINSKITLSASVLDFGRINWRYDLNNLNFKGEYEFPQAYIEASGINFLTKKPDFSIDKENFYELFKVEDKKDQLAYSITLPTNFYCGLNYLLNPKLNIAMADRYIYLKDLKHNSFSLTSNYNINDNLTICAGYSIIGNSFNNIPFALLFNWYSGQTYIGTDNALFFLFPSGSEVTGITFGTSLYLFRKKSKYRKDTENRPFYKEKISRPVNKNGLIFNN